MIIYVIVSLFETQSIDFSNSYTTFIPTFFPVSSGHLRRGYKIISCRRIARIQVVFIVEDTLSRHLLARNHNYSDACRYFFLPTHISRWPLWKDRTRLNKSRPTSILIFDRLENIFFFFQTCVETEEMKKLSLVVDAVCSYDLPVASLNLFSVIHLLSCPISIYAKIELIY